jgi:hypothetical protein
MPIITLWNVWANSPTPSSGPSALRSWIWLKAGLFARAFDAFPTRGESRVLARLGEGAL